MGLDIGADYVGHGGTNGILACPVEPGQSKLISNKALWINSKGERFANEAGQTHDIYYDVAHFDDQKFFAVYDQAMVDALDEDLRSKLDFGLERSASTALRRRRRSTRTTSWPRPARIPSSRRRPRTSSRSRRLPSTC